MYPLQISYIAEGKQLLKIVDIIPIDKIPPNSNIVNSHVLYKFKSNDEKTLTLKARIASHGNEDRGKELLMTDCLTSSSVGIRIVGLVEALMDINTRR